MVVEIHKCTLTHRYYTATIRTHTYKHTPIHTFTHTFTHTNIQKTEIGSNVRK